MHRNARKDIEEFDKRFSKTDLWLNDLQFIYNKAEEGATKQGSYYNDWYVTYAIHYTFMIAFMRGYRKAKRDSRKKRMS